VPDESSPNQQDDHSPVNEPGPDLLRDLAARLGQLRRERDLSQDEVAAYVGVSQPTWSRIERTGELSVGALLRLQELFDCETVESFFGELPSRRLARETGGGAPGSGG
jgi:transcriptional regulator with XRE-family HTH domain